MPQRFPLLFIRDRAVVAGYEKPGQPRGTKITTPTRSSEAHGRQLQADLNEVWKEFKSDQVARFADGQPYADGVKVTFFSSPGFLVKLESLESDSKKIFVVNSQFIQNPNGSGEDILQVVAYIPVGKEGYFLKKIEKYLAGNENERINKPLIDSINHIERTLLEHLWQDAVADLPGETAQWCECWVRLDVEKELKVRTRLEELCTFYTIELSDDKITFPERAVYLLKANSQQLTELLTSFNQLAELRKARQPVSFWARQTNVEQVEWVEHLRERVIPSDDTGVRVLILDTGVNRGHQLLTDFIDEDGLHAARDEWGVSDHGDHGTYMAGLALYGDLHEVLQHTKSIHINHRIESSKILPPKGNNPKRLYGDITARAISKAEIANSDAKRIFCMAVTIEGDNWGRATSYSGVIDQLASAYGEELERARLILISAGNTLSSSWADYPESIITSTVEDPAQAWNALVVGAYTQRTVIDDQQTYGAYTPIAPAQGISPFSRGSMLWEDGWPQKPDIVMEGGNAGLDQAANFVSKIEDLSILSLSQHINERQFKVDVGTSPATAKAAHLCALIQTQYPHAWPETIRGLMVHSAEWTDAMLHHFLQGNSKTDYENLIRCCGYGVPNPSKALYCSENLLTVIAQETIQPFQQIDAKTVRPRDIHYFEFPWPTQVLKDLGSTETRMRITLSYFVEPSPGNIGYDDRKRYASHGLRFDVNGFEETETQFKKRINQAARTDGEKPTTKGDSNRWLIGSNARNRGSIHTDEITSTAAQLAECRYIAIYPVGGWWKTREHKGRGDSQSRYALIVTLETEAAEVDIYTNVANQIKNKVPVVVRTL